MVSMGCLYEGARVKIVDEWAPDGSCGQNSEGLMDRYLGRVVTVAKMHGYEFFTIVEDGGRWAWGGECVDAIVDEDDGSEIEPASEAELLSFLAFAH